MVFATFRAQDPPGLPGSFSLYVVPLCLFLVNQIDLPSYRAQGFCQFVRLKKFTFSLLKGGFTSKLHLPNGKGGQQEGPKHLHWKCPTLASISGQRYQWWNSETFVTWYWGWFDLETSIKGSKKTSNIVQCLLHSQQLCGVIRSAGDFFLLASLSKDS
jgi:hypothetical protein